jgi:hypothetical protein
MKTAGRWMIVAGVLVAVYMALISMVMLGAMKERPMEWMAGVSIDLTVVWLVILVAGFGYVLGTAFLALLGLVWGPGRRAAALWLLVLPAVPGLLLAAATAAALVKYQPDWPRYLPYAFAMALPPLLFLIAGVMFRSRLVTGAPAAGVPPVVP